MLGSGRAGQGDRLESWEFMRIESTSDQSAGLAGKTVFRASPQGREWTTFSLSADHGPGLAFVNSANDYPQRVRYWRDGERLMAEISQLDGTRSRRWSFRRAGQ
jgi:hypothetical protein